MLWHLESWQRLFILAIKRIYQFYYTSIFLWLPLGGWLIYVSVKFIVSGVLGLFIVPYHVAKFVIDNTDS